MLVLRRRWRSSPTGTKKLKRNMLLLLLIIVLLTVQSFVYIEKNLRPPLVNLAKVRIKQMATQAINKAISDRIARGTNFEKLIDWRTDKNGKTTGFMLNYAEHMRITAETIETVQGQLSQLQAIPEHIPLGQAMNSSIIASFGPNIPVRLVPAGNVKVDLNTRYQNAGINMILVEVYIHITAEVSVIIPFDSEPEVVETEVPVSYALIVGDVPTYYFDGKGNSTGANTPPPNLSLPRINAQQSKNGVESGAHGSTSAEALPK
ncbi:sporulation protein YunB [Paenibacillus sp. OAS669]|uniref:sporulation protein YunB n=1 Tax=Paenibacillus sp. OAS669 TaxID=2663821 RepID=UPI0019EA6688|nr:sporulation protein YunB [Paenibacillus sp. OAS669]MBE1444371.1 sporulation protein YunB [Paenibacillus sp. OAS669]